MAEFARRAGVSRQAIHDLVVKGVIFLGPDKLLNPAEAFDSIAAVRDPARHGKIISGPMPGMEPAAVTQPGQPAAGASPPSPEEATSFHAAKTRRELALAKLAEIDLAEREKRLIPLDLMVKVVADNQRQVAAILEAIPSKLRIHVGLSADAIDLVTQEIVAARKAAAGVTVDLEDAVNGLE